MDFFRQYPGFSSLISICVLGFIAEIVFIFMSVSSEADAKKDYESALRKWKRVAALPIQPSQENLEKSEGNIQSLKDFESKLEENILEGAGSDIAAGAPSDGSEMFFELQAFIERFRKDAAIPFNDFLTKEPRSIKVSPDFTFGFGAFMDSGKGPKPEYIPAVYTQQQVLNFLLVKLYDAQPHSLVAVARDPVEVEVDRDDRRYNRGSRSLPRDTFSISPFVSARRSGAIDTYAFKLVFTGRSEALRNFLNSVGSFEWPLVVRSVEVKPADPAKAQTRQQETTSADFFSGFDNAASADHSGGKQEQIPVVDNSLSEFTVIIELIQVAQESPSEEPAK